MSGQHYFTYNFSPGKKGSSLILWAYLYSLALQSHDENNFNFTPVENL